MANDNELMRELRNLSGDLRGLAAKAVINYLLVELSEINSVNREELEEVLLNAMKLIEVEERDINRVKELITRLRSK
ncbi:hypothetical protein [Vulcanisaeta souniana]|uniref:Uncharacterized protein n=1 Tax=Vulcanisaeta souniana JCM 11219 TaxID=1293586 RepID=A0A830E2T5_9CREN|nr:hypothetical protein [Vulcanisaeta souniana]BDR91156.1 hypothetical protein Vsou_02490 [Vulcanisaeta souniana JCM 11219]GGI81278.1 hypothetical protein GCM10007112_17530 [Vulcanisaeta souniana JCM 11219]